MTYAYRAPSPKRPRPHQQEALEAVCRGFAEHDRGQLIMACGTGKTLVALWVMERLKAERTLVLLPSLSLLDQTLREWTANASRPFEFLAVCSDETVVGEDHLVSHTADLGLPVTTDPADIARFLEQEGPSVIFATYQSSPRIAEAMETDRDLLRPYHRRRSPSDGGTGSSDFATVLDAEPHPLESAAVHDRHSALLHRAGAK